MLLNKLKNQVTDEAKLKKIMSIRFYSENFFSILGFEIPKLLVIRADVGADMLKKKDTGKCPDPLL